MNKALLTLIEKDHMTVTHCLLFMLQPIYLHNLSLHMSSQPITSSFYKWPLYLLTNQIADQGFWIFNWLKLSLDCVDGFRTGCLNISHQQQSFSGLQSPRWSFSIKVCYSCIQTIFLFESHLLSFLFQWEFYCLELTYLPGRYCEEIFCKYCCVERNKIWNDNLRIPLVKYIFGHFYFLFFFFFSNCYAKYIYFDAVS